MISKKLLALFLAFIIFGSILLSLRLPYFFNNQLQSSKNSYESQDIYKNQLQQYYKIEIDPVTESLSNEVNLKLNISKLTPIINPNVLNEANLFIQFEFGFDPLILMNPVVESKLLFQQSNIIINKIDLKNGRISYAIELLPLQTTKNSLTIANLKFINSNKSTIPYAEIEILPKSNIQSTDKINLLKESPKSIKIQFPNLIPSTP